MKTWTWPIGSKRAALALGLVVCCGTAGCSFFPHRELTAPCSDYKAASFAPAAAPGAVPCDDPLPMARPPWTAALELPARAGVERPAPAVVGGPAQIRSEPIG